MGPFRYSGNIPKERQLFNASALSGIEYSLQGIYRSDSYNDSFTERIGKGILNDQDISQMGRIFQNLLSKESFFAMERVCTITIHKTQLVPVIIAFLKYLQSVGYKYKGQSKEQSRVSNQITLVLNLIKGLDPSLRMYAMVDALIASIWNYYFDNHQIYE